MWRRLYLLLLLVRFYFALSPSYIHPDEHFQGVEVIAGTLRPSAPQPLSPSALPAYILIDPARLAPTGDIFGWQTTRTWEFTSPKPIRSVFPLWAAYGLPMQLLHLITGDSAPSPTLIYYMLRVLFFLVSFVLGMCPTPFNYNVESVEKKKC